MKKIYLDWAATAPADPAILQQMHDISRNVYGNPSSSHSSGRTARKHIDHSRRLSADVLNVSPDQIVFTSGGSEANAIPLLSLIRRKKSGRIIISAIEHAAVWEFSSLYAELGYDLIEIKPDQYGIIRADKLAQVLTPDTIAVAVMAVNNETGAIQPVDELGEVIGKFEKHSGASIHFHCDMVQAAGKIPLQLKRWNVDTAAFSAHKIGGPRGTGILYVKEKFPVLFSGGGQEYGMRPGTENTAGIRAISEALGNRLENTEKDFAHASRLNSRLVSGIERIEGCSLIPELRPQMVSCFSPYILSFSAAPVPGEVLTRVLNDRGVLVGSGSACSSNRQKKHGRVLRAMGTDSSIAGGVVRVSIGHSSTMEEIESFHDILREELKLLRKTLKLS